MLKSPYCLAPPPLPLFISDEEKKIKKLNEEIESLKKRLTRNYSFDDNNGNKEKDKKNIFELNEKIRKLELEKEKHQIIQKLTIPQLKDKIKQDFENLLARYPQIKTEQISSLKKTFRRRKR